MSAGQHCLVLIGPMGAGKSSTGRRVARSLGVPFTDTDAVVVREHGPIAELFRAHGEQHFRTLERAVVAEALTRGGVVALGGGAVMDSSTRAALHAHDVALLTVSAAAVQSRIRGNTRPLLAEENPVQHWQRILAERMPTYTAVADRVWDTSAMPMSATAAEIAEWARERGHQREQESV